jgi:uncharacterized membrane protein
MKGRLARLSPRHQFVLAVTVAMLTSLSLYGYSALRNYGLQYEYLIWNLFLAALPLLFAFCLVRSLKHKLWSDWAPIGWTLLWLLFLPNSFYMITDYIHLREIPADTILYAAVLFTSFIYFAAALGFGSLALIHDQLRRRLTPLAASAWVGGILLACSFAIYIGRDLRWNSWDVLFNPAGLLFDISDRLLRPDDYPVMFMTMISFFVLLSSLYAVVWTAGRLLRSTAK